MTALSATHQPSVHLTHLQEKLLALETRNRIYQEVQRSPGAHMRLLARDLQMPIGTLEHHLHMLEKFGLLCSHRDGRVRHFFLAGHPLSEDPAFRHLLRNDAPRRILQEILQEEELDHATLDQRLPLPGSTVSYHARRLAALDLVERFSVGRGTWYRIRNDEHARRLLAACPNGAHPASRRR